MYYTLEGEKIHLPYFMKHLGSGAEGNVYQYDEATALKRYRRFLSKDELVKQRTNAIRLTGINIENFICPTQILLDKHKMIRGYFMPLIKVEKQRLSTTLSISEWLELWNELMNSIETFVFETNLIVSDSNYHNLILGEHFYFIDTPSFIERYQTMTKENAVQYNRIIASSMFVKRLLKETIVQIYGQKDTQKRTWKENQKITQMGVNATQFREDLRKISSGENVKILEKKYLDNYEDLMSIIRR